MELTNIAFYLFAIVVLGSAAVVVFSKKLMHSAFALLFTLFGVAGFYVLLLADFIAITQIMVYIGGILILIIFAVMMTQRISDVNISSGKRSKSSLLVAGLSCAVVAVTLIIMYGNANFILKEIAPVDSTIKPIGKLLMTDYLLAFEVAGVLLLIAFIGAALIARRDRKDLAKELKGKKTWKL